MTRTPRGGRTGFDLDEFRPYLVAVRAVTGVPADASDWTNSANAYPALQPPPSWPGGPSFSFSRGDGSLHLWWLAPPYSQGYEIECATGAYGGTYTLCADVETATVTNGRVNATISSWTAGGTNYTIDNDTTYNLAIRITNAWGVSPYVRTWPIYPLALTVSGVTSRFVTITLDGHSYDWYYKASTGPDATCQGPVSGQRGRASKTVPVGVDLTAGETYGLPRHTATARVRRATCWPRRRRSPRPRSPLPASPIQGPPSPSPTTPAHGGTRLTPGRTETAPTNRRERVSASPASRRARHTPTRRTARPAAMPLTNSPARISPPPR